MNNTKVALFGLGNMGYLIAERLAKTCALSVSDLDAALKNKAQEELGVMLIEQPQDISDIDVVVLCLPSPAISRTVLTQIGPSLKKGAIVIETSTVNPADVEACQRVIAPYDAHIIDASILAGVSQMQAGTATLLLGGNAQVIARCQSVLDAIANKQIHFGPIGAGAAAKVINNAVAHAVMIVVAEAGSMATAAGVSCKKLIDLLADPQMGLHRPLTHRYAERVVQGNYDGGMPLEAARKDSTLALELAQSLGVPLFAIQGSHTPYEIAAASGYGRDDYAAVARVWADWGRPAVPA